MTPERETIARMPGGIAEVVVTVIALVNVGLVPLEWRKRRPYDAAFQMNKTLFGERAAAAIRRSLPSGTGVLCSLAVFSVLEFAHGHDALSYGVFQAGADVAGVGFLSFGIAVVAVVLVNGPKWLVPPHLRGEPGLISKRSGSV